MKLVELTLENFRGAPDGAFAFADPSTGRPHDLVLITGGPSSGKTSILDAIAAMMQLLGGHGPPPDPARLRRRGAASGAIEATWLLTEDEAAAAGVDGLLYTTRGSLAGGPAELFPPRVREVFSPRPDPIQAKLELFPASRRISLAPVPPRWPPPDLADPRHRPSKDPLKYAGVRAALVDVALRSAFDAADRLATRGLLARWEQPDPLAGIKRSLAALAPWLRLAGVQQRGDTPKVGFQRRDGVEVELEDLSDGEQQALLFSVVFDRIGLDRAVVLIDLPELFIHPGGQLDFLRALEGLGEGNQILAATTSPEILAATPPQRVLRLGPRAE
jgi:hypothetical protein